MAKFTAIQPTSNFILAGISILANPNGVRFDDIEGGGFTAESSSGIRLEIEGHGFKGAFGRPKAVGTVTDIKYFSDGTPTYKLKDAKYAFKKLASSNDSAEHTEKIFAKDDIINGSKSSVSGDFLYGFDGDDRISGNAGNDALYGGRGRDVLNGGDGYDTLDGGKGKDAYVFKSDPNTGYDTIVKFQEGERIELKAKFFAELAVGELLDEQFVIASSAQEADDRIIFDSANGWLLYDVDGTGAVAPLYFAKMQPGVDYLSIDNFTII
jgi:Ca2+-binding RTX toxin-like protein